MKRFVFVAAATLSLGACQTTTSDSSPVTPAAAPVAGGLEAALKGRRTLGKDGSRFYINPTGALEGTLADGTPVLGTWQIINEQWCRELTTPERFAGYKCQDVTIAGNTVTFHRDDGSAGVYTFEN